MLFTSFLAVVCVHIFIVQRTFSQDAPTQLVSPHHPSSLHQPRPSPLNVYTTDYSRLLWACCTVVAPFRPPCVVHFPFTPHAHPPTICASCNQNAPYHRSTTTTNSGMPDNHTYVRTLHPVQVTAEEGRTANSNSTLNPATTPRHHHLCHRCAPPRHHTRVRRASSCHCAPRQLCVCDCSAVRLFSTSIVFMALVVACTRLFTHLTLTITLQLTCISATLAHSHLSHKLKRSPSHTRPYALLVARRPAST
jgi:hypothetical protein